MTATRPRAAPTERAAKLTTKVHAYPNPEYKWCVVSIDGVEIGRCDVRPDGYLLRRKRKVLPLHDAAVLLVKVALKDAQRRLHEANADAERARKQLAALKVTKRGEVA